jgi:hypothetical protein
VAQPGPQDGQLGEVLHGSLPFQLPYQVLPLVGAGVAHGVDRALDTEALVLVVGAHARGQPGAVGALERGALDHGPAADQVALMAVPAALAALASEDLRVCLGLRSPVRGLIAARPWPLLRLQPQVSRPSQPPSTARL